MTQQSFLAVHDYGQGGVWLLLEAQSHGEAQAMYPMLTVFETRPDWMTESDEAEYRAHCLEIGFCWKVEQPTGWLLEHFPPTRSSSGG